MVDSTSTAGTPRTPSIRDARDEDALDVIELIGSVFGEYTGCILDVDGEMPELRRIASTFRDHGGAFWVAEREGRIVGMVGWVPTERQEAPTQSNGIELKKLYVHRRERRTGLGGKLVGRVEHAARERGAAFIDLWSDTRFTTAHAFYERRGYERGPATRDLGDSSKTVEFYFKKMLNRSTGR